MENIRIMETEGRTAGKYGRVIKKLLRIIGQFVKQGKIRKTSKKIG